MQQHDGDGDDSEEDGRNGRYLRAVCLVRAIVDEVDDG